MADWLRLSKFVASSVPARRRADEGRVVEFGIEKGEQKGSQAGPLSQSPFTTRDPGCAHAAGPHPSHIASGGPHAGGVLIAEANKAFGPTHAKSPLARLPSGDDPGGKHIRSAASAQRGLGCRHLVARPAPGPYLFGPGLFRLRQGAISAAPQYARWRKEGRGRASTGAIAQGSAASAVHFEFESELAV